MSSTRQKEILYSEKPAKEFFLVNVGGLTLLLIFLFFIPIAIDEIIVLFSAYIFGAIYFDALYISLKPEIYEDGLRRPGSIINKLLRRGKIHRDEILHISDWFLLSLNENKNLILCEFIGYFIYTKDGKKYRIRNPWYYYQIDIRPILQRVFGDRWNEVYLGSSSCGYFSQIEIHWILIDKKITGFYKYYLYPRLLSVYLISPFFTWNELPMELKPIENKIINNLQRFFGMNLRVLRSLPVQEYVAECKVKPVRKYKKNIYIRDQ